MSEFNKVFEKIAGGENASYRNLGKNVPAKMLEGKSKFIQMETTPKVVNVVDWEASKIDTKYQEGVLTIAAKIDEVDGKTLDETKMLTKSSLGFARNFIKAVEGKSLPIKLKVWKKEDTKYNKYHKYYVEEVQN